MRFEQKEMAAGMSREERLEQVLETAVREADGGKVSVGDLMAHYGTRSFGPIFLLLGLLSVLAPLGGIPGLPAAVGVVILLFSLQMVLGRKQIWLPGFVRDLSIEGRKIEKAEDKAGDQLKFIDRMITSRLRWATSGAAQYIAAALVSVMALIMIPLELVPFAVAVPGTAISMVGLALLARDGALMLLAFALSAVGLGVLIVVSPIGSSLGLG